MDAQTLAEIFDTVYLREFSEFDSAPRHFFSLRHCRKMKKILYPDTVYAGMAKRGAPLKKRLLIALLVIILSLLGIAAGAELSKSFAVEEYRGRTMLWALKDDNAPKTIETRYHLPNIPDGLEQIYENADKYNIYILYSDASFEKEIFFDQSVKNGFAIDLETLTGEPEEIEINGRPACYLAFGDVYGAVAWDNGEYILEVGGNFEKDELIALAESVELKGE